MQARQPLNTCHWHRLLGLPRAQLVRHSAPVLTNKSFTVLTLFAPKRDPLHEILAGVPQLEYAALITTMLRTVVTTCVAAAAAVDHIV